MKKIKFEDALAQLESIVRNLEDGETSLDEALKLFEKGIELARFCHRKLDEAEAKVELLVDDNDGQRVEKLEVDAQ